MRLESHQQEWMVTHSPLAALYMLNREVDFDPRFQIRREEEVLHGVVTQFRWSNQAGAINETLDLPVSWKHPRPPQAQIEIAAHNKTGRSKALNGS